MSASQNLRFGIIGTGRITRRLVADLQSTDGVEVSSIASRTLERARFCADQYGVGTPVEGYQSLLERDDVDAVYISLPPSMHAEWSIAAAQHGRHVLCEKPLATSYAEAQSIHVACESSGVRWLDATGWLHHRRTEAFADWIKAGRLGKLGRVSASMSFYRPFLSDDHRLDASLGGGCVLDLGWYTVGLARFVAGKLPSEVLADTVLGEGVPQRMTAVLWFDDDLTATLSCGYDTASRKWFEIAGTTATLTCDDFSRPWHDRPTRCSIHDAAGKVEQHGFDGNQEHAMIAKFAGGGSLTTYHEQALDTQRILDSLEQSAKHRQRVSL